MSNDLNRIAMVLPIASQYSSLNYFINALGQGLERCGVAIEYFDPNRLQGSSGLKTAIRAFEPDLVLAMNSFLLDSSNTPLWSYLSVPYLAYLVDLPHQFIPFDAPSRVIVANVDKRAHLFFKGHLNHSSSIFLPHAVEEDLLYQSEKERMYPISLFATCIDYESFRERWQKSYPEDVVQLLEGVIEEAEQQPQKDLLSIVLDYSGSSGRLETMGGVNTPFLADMWCLADLYIRGKARIQLVRSIHSHPLHIWGQSMGGRGWDYYIPKDQKNVIIHAPVTFKKTLALMQESEIVLNSFPIFKEGVHERVLSGMACGAVVVADQTPFMRKGFVDQEELILFDTYRLEEIDHQLQKILSDKDRKAAISKNARKKIRTSYTWDVRAEELLQKTGAIISPEEQ